MNRRIVTIARAAAAAGFALAGAQAQAANLIKNGGFEALPVGDGSFTTYPLGQTIGAWRVVGEPHDVAVVSKNFKVDLHVEPPVVITFPAKRGNQWLDLTGLSSNHHTGVEQTVKTVPGQRYALSFWLGNIADTDSNFGFESQVRVFVDGVELPESPFKVTGGTPHVLTWKKFGASFPALKRRTVVKFLNEDPLSDDSNGLDEVSLAAVAE